MHAKAYFECILQTHGWDTTSDQEKNDSVFNKNMNSSRPISLLSPDCLDQLFKHVGPKEHTPEAIVLQKTAGFSYQTVLGELMYAYITCRPDIGYAITTLSKFSSAPSAFHYKQLRHIAKYVRSTIDWGIEFVRPSLLSDLPPTVEHKDLPKLEEEYPVDINIAKLLCFVDASHATDLQKRRSITGFVFTYCGGAIVYRSKTQSITAGSSCESEFIAAYSACKVVRYLRYILKQLHFEQTEPTPVYIDNLSALKIINDNTAPTERTRHMDIRFFALQDWREDGDIKMIHIKGTLNNADDLTKALG